MTQSLTLTHKCGHKKQIPITPLMRNTYTQETWDQRLREAQEKDCQACQARLKAGQTKIH